MTRDSSIIRRLGCGFLVLILLVECSHCRCLAGMSGTWTGTTSGGLWSNAGNWSGGIVADGTDATADFSTLNITADNTVHLDTPRAIGFLRFGDTTPSNNWTLDNNGNSLDTLTLASSSGGPLIQVKNQTATISAILTGSQGFFTTSGTGTLTLTGANTLSGPTYVEGGFLQLSNGLALQNSTLSQVNSNTLIFGSSIGSFTLGGLSGAYNLSLTDKLGAAIDLRVGNNNADTSYTGTLSGAGSLTKVGTGTLTLSTANTYTGPTTIDGGALLLSTSPAPLFYSTVVCNSVNGLAFSQTTSTDVTIGGLAGAADIALSPTLANASRLVVGANNANTTYSGALSGTEALKKIGSGVLTLGGPNSYSGGTTISSGTIKLDGIGTLGDSTAPVDIEPTGILDMNGLSVDVGSLTGPTSGLNPINVVNNKSGTLATLTIDVPQATSNFGGVIADNSTGNGQIALVKIGSGTQTLFAGGYTGTTTVEAGTLQANFLARNGSSTTFIAAASDFSTASLIRTVQSRGSYAGIGSTAIGSAIGTSADLRAGRSSLAFNVKMQWRIANPSSDGPLLSDVLNLTGMSVTSGSHVQTDAFAIQMTYDPNTLFGREAMLAAGGAVELAWLSPSGWQDAATGDFGAGLPGNVFQNVQSSWDAFAGAHSVTDANVGNFLGSYGVDVAHHTVWAVVNHNSQFSVVPEPSALVLASCGIVVCLWGAFRRRFGPGVAL